MRSAVSKVLKAEFHKRMRKALPSFEKIGTEFGGVIYRKSNQSRRRNVFVFLSPSPKYDRFTIELAISSAPNFPFDLLPGEKGAAGGTRLRVRKTALGGGGWWSLNRSDEPDIVKILAAQADVESSLSNIGPAVENAILCLCDALESFVGSETIDN